MDRTPVTKCTVGLDMSLTSTGFCKLSGPVVSLETIKTTPQSHPVDLNRIMYIVDSVMTRIPPDVSLICIEDYFIPQSKFQFGAAINLVGLGTLMRTTLFVSGMPFFVIAPGQLKKFVTGKGVGQKSLILREVYKKWGVDAKDDNQADACVLAKIADAIIEYMKGNKNFPKYQLEVLKKVTKDRPRYNCERL